MRFQTRTPARYVASRIIMAQFDSTDSQQVTRLFSERLQAWKHACGYLEDYIQSTEKMQHAHAKEYEKVLKVRFKTSLAW